MSEFKSGVPGIEFLDEKLVDKIRAEAIGWTWAEACNSLDNNIDPRTLNVHEVLLRALEDLSA